MRAIGVASEASSMTVGARPSVERPRARVTHESAAQKSPHPPAMPSVIPRGRSFA